MDQTRLRDRMRGKRAKLLGWVKRPSSKSPSSTAQPDITEPPQPVSEVDTRQHNNSSFASGSVRTSFIRAHDASNLNQAKGTDSPSKNSGSGTRASNATASASQHGDSAEDSLLHSTNIGAVGMSLWHRAMNQLPFDERQVFVSILGDVENLSGGDVFHELETAAQTKKLQITDKHQRNDEKPSLRVFISRIVVCIRRFKEVGDIAVSFDPTHAALPWAAIRFILEVSVAFPLTRTVTTSVFPQLTGSKGYNCGRRAVSTHNVWPGKGILSWSSWQSLRTAVQLQLPGSRRGSLVLARKGTRVVVQGHSGFSRTGTESPWEVSPSASDDCIVRPESGE